MLISIRCFNKIQERARALILKGMLSGISALRWDVIRASYLSSTSYTDQPN